MEFRFALSISPFSPEMLEKGYTYFAGDSKASSLEELQKLYIEHGATEIFARVATKRYDDGKTEHHEREHTLERALSYAKIAAKLGVPFNPEIGVFRLYSDMEGQTAPDFSEYPEIKKSDKEWNRLSLEEMCEILEQYGYLVASEILETGCKVNVWDIGNETNFGFAGVEAGQECACSHRLSKASHLKMYLKPHFGARWLSRNVWPYNARMMAAVARGIKRVDKKARFSSHIATVIADKKTVVEYFKCLKNNGYAVDEAGISFYPSAFGIERDRMKKVKGIINKVNEDLNIPVFIAEFGYPSKLMAAGHYKTWSNKTKGYKLTPQGQSSILRELIIWGKKNGVSGIRPWAPDLLEPVWESMAFFELKDNRAVEKPVMKMLRSLF